MKTDNQTTQTANSTKKLDTNPPPCVRIAWRAAACLLGLLGYLSAANADTYVSGPIAGQTWTTAGSPYRVTGNINVALLTINPGVTVIFQSNYLFEVDGFLTATGTLAQPITFTRTNGGGWSGIFFNYCQNGSEMDYCKVSAVQGGSAIACITANPVLRSCVVFSNASSGEAGGLYVDNRSYPGSEMLVQSCTFSNNTSASHGGAVSAHTGTNEIQFVGCSIISNAANPTQATLNLVGGGIYLDGNGSFDACTIDNNAVYASDNGTVREVYVSGGGIYWSGNGSMRNTFVRHNACWSYAPYDGNYSASYGGAADLGGVLLLQNCVVSYNTATSKGDSRGGGIYQASGASTIVNCTIANNNIEGFRLDGGSSTIANSIFYFNNGGGVQIVNSPTVSYSDVQGSYAGTGNIAINPVFADTNSLMLLVGSRCIDAGDPNPIYNDLCFPPSLGGDRNDMGAYGGSGACWWYAHEEPSIVREPQSQSSCLGQTVSFSVTATGSDPLGYQWYFKGSPLAGQTGTNMVVAGLLKTNAGSYQVVVSNIFGSVTSAPAQLTVYDACIDLHMYAGLNISGQQGSSYVLSYSTDLSNTNG